MKATTKTSNFEKTIQAYENSVLQNDKNPDTLQELARAVTYSVLKKCIDKSYNKQLTKIRTSVAKSIAYEKNLQNATNSIKLTVNNNGDLQNEVIDKKLHFDFNALIQDTLGDGCDLIQDAILSILEQTMQARERNTSLSFGFMTKSFVVRRLKKKVWIKSEDSIRGWEEVNTTPIQECFKAVRRSIENSRAIQVASHKYTYIEDYAMDSESNTEEKIYHRLPKYYDLGGAVTDFNGKEVCYTANEKSLQDYRDMQLYIEQLNLTQRQSVILDLRLKGYGYKAIGTYLGITPRAVAKNLERIQVKTVDIGLF